MLSANPEIQCKLSGEKSPEYKMLGNGKGTMRIWVQNTEYLCFLAYSYWHLVVRVTHCSFYVLLFSLFWPCLSPRILYVVVLCWPQACRRFPQGCFPHSNEYSLSPPLWNLPPPLLLHWYLPLAKSLCLIYPSVKGSHSDLSIPFFSKNSDSLKYHSWEYIKIMKTFISFHQTVSF